MQPGHIACPGATADPPGGLKHHRGQPACRQPPRRGNTRGAGSDYDHVGDGAHGSQGRLSKRRLMIRQASGCLGPSRATAESRRTRQSDLADGFASHRAASHRGRGERSTEVCTKVEARNSSRADLSRKSRASYAERMTAQELAALASWIANVGLQGSTETTLVEGFAARPSRPAFRSSGRSCSSIRYTPFTRGGYFAGNAISLRRPSPNMGGAQKVRPLAQKSFSRGRWASPSLWRPLTASLPMGRSARWTASTRAG